MRFGPQVAALVDDFRRQGGMRLTGIDRHEPVGAREECRRNVLVLLGLARAGRVDETAARCDSGRRVAAAS